MAPGSFILCSPHPPLIDRSVNRCRGAGLVRFATRDQAEAAIDGLTGVVLPNSLNGSAMQLRVLVSVSLALFYLLLSHVLQFADTPDQKLERRHRNRRVRGVTKSDPLTKGRYDPLGPHPPNRTPSPSAASPASIALSDATEAVPYYAPYGLPYAMPPIMGPSLPIPSLSPVRRHTIRAKLRLLFLGRCTTVHPVCNQPCRNK